MGLWEAMRGADAAEAQRPRRAVPRAERGDHAPDGARLRADRLRLGLLPLGRRGGVRPDPGRRASPCIRDDAEAPEVTRHAGRLRLHLAGRRRRPGRHGRPLHRPPCRQHHPRAQRLRRRAALLDGALRQRLRSAVRADLPLQAGHVLPLRAAPASSPATPCWSCPCATSSDEELPMEPDLQRWLAVWKAPGPVSADDRTPAARPARAGDRPTTCSTAPPRRELDALVDLAAQVAGVPFAAVNLLSSRHQHQVATVGLRRRATPREDSMCRLVVESGQPDHGRGRQRTTPASPTTRGRPARSPSVKYYGSHPLRTPAGVVIGTLCVFDDEAHPVTPETARGLAQLADRVVDVLELELASRRLERGQRAAEHLQRAARALRGPGQPRPQEPPHVDLAVARVARDGGHRRLPGRHGRPRPARRRPDDGHDQQPARLRLAGRRPR